MKNSPLTHIDFTQVACYVNDMVSQKIIENNHVRFLSEEDVVREILNDLGDNHQTLSNDHVVLCRHFYIDHFRRNHRGGDESEAWLQWQSQAQEIE